MGSDVRKLTEEERARTRRWVAMLDQDRATMRDEVEQDVAQYRGISPEDPIRVGVVKGGWRLLQERSDMEAVLAFRDPPAPDFEPIRRRLFELYRAKHADSSRRSS